MEKNWVMCTCRGATCLQCEAERQATLAARVWLDSHEQDGAYSELLADKEALLSQLNYLIQHGDAVRVHYTPDSESYTQPLVTSKYTFRLHTSLCTKGVLVYACGLVAVQYAQRMLEEPPPVTCYTYSVVGSQYFMMDKAFYGILKQSLADGIGMYSANYGESEVRLNAKDTMMIGKKQGFKVTCEESLSSNQVGDLHLLATLIVKLKLNQILMLFRMEDYTVWSIMHWTSTLIHVFSSRQQKAEAFREMFGGTVYQVVKNWYTALETLTLMEQDYGSLEGLSYVILEK